MPLFKTSIVTHGFADGHSGGLHSRVPFILADMSVIGQQERPADRVPAQATSVVGNPSLEEAQVNSSVYVKTGDRTPGTLRQSVWCSDEREAALTYTCPSGASLS